MDTILHQRLTVISMLVVHICTQQETNKSVNDFIFAVHVKEENSGCKQFDFVNRNEKNHRR